MIWYNLCHVFNFFLFSFFVLWDAQQDAKNANIEHVIILSGDHLYRMDYMDFVQVSDPKFDLSLDLHIVEDIE